MEIEYETAKKLSKNYRNLIAAVWYSIRRFERDNNGPPISICRKYIILAGSPLTGYVNACYDTKYKYWSEIYFRNTTIFLPYKITI